MTVRDWRRRFVVVGVVWFVIVVGLCVLSVFAEENRSAQRDLGSYQILLLSSTRSFQQLIDRDDVRAVVVVAATKCKKERLEEREEE